MMIAPSLGERYGRIVEGAGLEAGEVRKYLKNMGRVRVGSGCQDGVEGRKTK